MQGRYTTLDGLRGIAAIFVVMFHARNWFGALAPNVTYLAVDFFFALSGFVIAAAYGSRLENGLSLGKFVLSRIVRMYPLYLVGICPSFLILIGSLLHRSEISDYNLMVWRSVPFGIFMLPSPTIGNLTSNYYPLNNPAWSLFFEMMINIFYALTFRFWSKRALVGVALVTGTVLLRYGGDLDAGWNWQTFSLGFARVGFSFPVGVLVYKLHIAGFRPPKLPSWVCIVAFTGLLFLPAAIAPAVAVIVGFPVVLAFAATASPKGAVERVFRFLGSISLALYAIHLPVMRLVEAVLHRLDIRANPLLIGFSFLTLVVAVSALLDQYYDGPLGRYLARIFCLKVNIPRVSSSPRVRVATSAS